MNYTRTDARVAKETAKGLLLERRGAGKVWVPKSHARVESDGTVSVSSWLKKDRHGFFTYENQRREQPMGMFNVKKGTRAWVAKRGSNYNMGANIKEHVTTKDNWFDKAQVCCVPSDADNFRFAPVAVKQGWYAFNQGDWTLIVHEDYVTYA